ncbi:MAG: hypothetical protein HXY21_03410 [Parvularculaceae bacterium]|nr:hypothetical protein [Parvularculaceae bacterium]
MRSHMIAFGVGGGLALVAAGALALIAPKFAERHDGGDGFHIVNITDGGRGSFHLKDDALDVSAEWKGDFSFAADGRSLTALTERLEVASKDQNGERKAVFENRKGAIVARAFKGDRETPAGADADREAGDLLQLFARSSGVNADSRVKAMLTAGGKARVIEEIGALVGGHAVGAYVEALAAEAALDDADVRVLAARVKGLTSDYAKRSALGALLTTQELSEASIAAIIDVAKTIEGDHELRLIVEQLAEKKISERNFAIASRLIDEIEGDHEVRLAVSALLESENLDDADAARALKAAAAKIDGDHELRLALESADERLQDGEVGGAGLAVIAAIEGDHERRLAIEDFADSLEGESPHWIGLAEAAKGVSSDHERRLAVEAIYGAAPQSSDIRAALRQVAETIGSDHERRLALEALD